MKSKKIPEMNVTQKLKAANTKLRRENRDLREKIRQLEHQLQVLGRSPEGQKKIEENRLGPVEHCPKCGHTLDVIQAGKFTMHKCQICEFKDRIESNVDIGE